MTTLPLLWWSIPVRFVPGEVVLAHIHFLMLMVASAALGYLLTSAVASVGSIGVVKNLLWVPYLAVLSLVVALAMLGVAHEVVQYWGLL